MILVLVILIGLHLAVLQAIREIVSQNRVALELAEESMKYQREHYRRFYLEREGPYR